MKKSLYIALIVIVLAFAALGQKLGKPTLISSPLTVAQQQTLREGVTLHDAKKYDEAISKYRSILAENPDCSAAMYELSLSLNEKGDKLAAVELAYKGSKYIADELPLFYVLIANNLDDLGKPQEAIGIYTDGLKALEGDNRFGGYRASLYFNLGITYLKQKRYNEARSPLKSAVENDYSYASPHFQLSRLYYSTKYKIPAFFAAARFLSLEFNTERSTAAAAIMADVLKPAKKDAKGNMTIDLDFLAPSDEGNFGPIEIIIPTLMTGVTDKDKKKTENELFVDAIDTVVAIASEDKKLSTTFVGKNYIPYMIEMKKNGYLEVFGYVVLYVSGKKDAMDWLKNNDAKFGSFVAWAKSYRLPPK